MKLNYAIRQGNTSASSLICGFFSENFIYEVAVINKTPFNSEVVRGLLYKYLINDLRVEEFFIYTDQEAFNRLLSPYKVHFEQF